MPLIVLCGRPGSGKTTRAVELAQFFHETYKKPVVLINEEKLQINKIEGYKDSVSEKMTRGFIKSNVEKYMSQDTITIVDSMNYIKGFRYELYCLVRSAKTTNCLLYVNSNYDVCKKYNSSHEGFNEELFEDLYKRMEVPKQGDRWDSPYFEIRFDEKTPLQEIAEVLLFQEKTAKNPTATKLETKNEGDFVQQTEIRMQEVLETISKTQNECLANNTPIRFNNTKLIIQINRVLGLVELKKLKQEFLNFMRVTPLGKLDQVSDGFISYIQAQVSRL